MGLRCKNPTDKNAENKFKVYFSCHPDDFELYFEEITEDILSLCNCEIYFQENLGEITADENYFSDIEQMNLFVFPVTSKFLLTENAARDIDFAFAVKNNTPILPLLQERELESLFNDKCGSYHLLDKYKKDDTQIPFVKKLKDFLDLLTVSDELAERVHAAFIGYIFLSYRKKDRLYAQNLMKRIHENPMFRDIAIWYDEFLVPGEDFNDAIAKAIENSDAFVVAVTPNLLEAGNYILTTEYPYAQSREKKMILAQMLPVDTELFRRYFVEAVNLVDTGDSERMSQALLSVFRTRLCQINEDPLHLFLIGIAYLYGISIEVNHQRAFELIERAAEGGLPEAMEKLASMYHIGEGVEQSFYKEIEWLSRLRNFWREEYVRNPCEETAFSFLRSLQMLSKAYTDISAYEKGKEDYECFYTLAAEIAEKYSSVSALEYLAESCEYMSNIDFTKTKSYDYLRKALVPRQELAKTLGTENALRQLSNLYLRLCEHSHAKSSEEKEEYYLRAIQILEYVSEKIPSMKNRLALADAVGKYALSYSSRQDVVMRAIGLYDMLWQTDKTFEVALNCILFYRKLYECMTLNESESIDLTILSGKINQIEINPPEAFENIHTETMYFYFLSGLALGKTDLSLPDAEISCIAAKNVGLELIRKTNSRFIRAKLGDIYDTLAHIAWRNHETEKAKSNFLKEAELLLELREEYHNFLTVSQLEFTYSFLADLAYEDGDNEAYEYYKALEQETNESTDFGLLWDSLLEES